MNLSTDPLNLAILRATLDADEYDQIVNQPQEPKVGSIDFYDQHEEADFAWAYILNEFGDFDCLDPESDERWQYMGSFKDGEIWMHEFRHRALSGAPFYTRRAYPASKEWKPLPFRERELNSRDLDKFAYVYSHQGVFYCLDHELDAKMEDFVRGKFGDEAMTSPTARMFGGWHSNFVYAYIEEHCPYLKAAREAKGGESL
jgi:hypothetical protein